MLLLATTRNTTRVRSNLSPNPCACALVWRTFEKVQRLMLRPRTISSFSKSPVEWEVVSVARCVPSSGHPTSSVDGFGSNSNLESTSDRHPIVGPVRIQTSSYEHYLWSNWANINEAVIARLFATCHDAIAHGKFDRLADEWKWLVSR